MNPDIKKKWIDALRSGKYPQGFDALFSVSDSVNAGYCCLGVLAHVAGILQYDTNGNGYVESSRGRKSYLVIPSDDDRGGTVPLNLDRYFQDECTRLNDYVKADFNQIASLIENDAIDVTLVNALINGNAKLSPDGKVLWPDDRSASELMESEEML